MNKYGAFDLCHIDLDLIDFHFELPCPLANWALCICDMVQLRG